MKKIIIILILFLTLSLSALELDKVCHFLCSAGIYTVSYDYLNTTSLDMDKIEGYSFWLATLTGVGKELYDVSQGGIFDEEDIAYDIAGVVVSLGFKRYVRNREYRNMMIMLGKNRAGISVRF